MLYMSPKSNSFMSRLYSYFKNGGIPVDNDPMKNYDVGLYSIGIQDKGNAKFKISRMDGCYFNNRINYKSKNSSIVKGLKKANGIIYQSNFAKSLCDKFLGEFNVPTKIIFNGDDPSYYKTVPPIEKKFKINMMASAKWRPLKRLRDIIEVFILLSLNDSCLFIAGDISESGLSKEEIKKYSQFKNIVFLGKIDLELLSSHLVVCDVFLHLSWIDSCSNSVVEAICAGIPVVCNNIGGTIEIVGPSGGYICDIDDPFDFKVRDFNFMPPIKREVVCEKIMQSINEKKILYTDHVNIKNIASDYLSFLHSFG